MFCPFCGSRENDKATAMFADGTILATDYHVGICGTEWHANEGEEPIFTEPTLACKEIGEIKMKLPGSPECKEDGFCDLKTFLFEIDGELFSSSGYETSREGAISTRDIWHEFDIARRILSGFSFSHNGDLEFQHNCERKILLQEWIAIGRPKPFPRGAST